MTIDNKCKCGAIMEIEPMGEMVRLTCVCGHHRTFNLKRVSKPSDTQPFTPVPNPKNMTEEELAEARAKVGL